MKLMGFIFSLLTPGFRACGWVLQRRRERVALRRRPARALAMPSKRSWVVKMKRAGQVLQFTRVPDLAAAMRLHREAARQQPWRGRN